MFLALITLYQLRIFTILHWQVAHPYHSYKALVDSLSYEHENYLENNTDNKISMDIINKAKRDVDFLFDGTKRIISMTQTYRITGLITFIVSLVSFIGKPRWVSIVTLPFGIFGLILSSVMV